MEIHKFTVAKVNFPLRLEMMAAENALFSSYEPELFPGLIFRMENPKGIFPPLVFNFVYNHAFSP